MRLPVLVAALALNACAAAQPVQNPASLTEDQVKEEITKFASSMGHMSGPAACGPA